jgi:hypothetical protein
MRVVQDWTVHLWLTWDEIGRSSNHFHTSFLCMRPPLHQHSYVTGWEHETNQLHSSITGRIHLTLVCGIPLCFLNLITVVDGVHKHFQFKN